MLKIECKPAVETIPRIISWEFLEEGPVYKIVSVIEDARRVIKIRGRVFVIAIDCIYDVTEIANWRKEKFRVSPDTVTLTFGSQ